MESETVWTSLEITRFIVSLITPLLVGVITYIIAKAAIKIERKKSLDSQLIKYRLEIYQQVAPLINDLYCFFRFLGNWKELTPETIITHKRKCDKIIFVNRSIFSDDLFNAYQVFSKLYFEMWTGIGEDAKIRVDKELFLEHWASNPSYKSEWIDLISSNKTEAEKLKSSYEYLIRQFSKDVGLS